MHFAKPERTITMQQTLRSIRVKADWSIRAIATQLGITKVQTIYDFERCRSSNQQLLDFYGGLVKKGRSRTL